MHRLLILALTFSVLLSAGSSGLECWAAWHHNPADPFERYFTPLWRQTGCGCLIVPYPRRAVCFLMDLEPMDGLAVSVREWYVDPLSPTGQRAGPWFAPDPETL